MLSTRQIGRFGEDVAAKYLVKNGYEIIDKNYLTDLGEIDLIAAGEGYLVFVEVKLRYNDEHGYGADAVNYAKQRKISQVAAQYIKRFRLYDEAVRFDVIEVYTSDKRVVHIKNAFDSFLRY